MSGEPGRRPAMSPADRQRARRARVAVEAGRELGRVGRPVSVAHGSNSRYVRGCRCVECRAAHALAMRVWRASR